MENSESKIISPETVAEQVNAILIKNVELTSEVVKGYDFNQGVNY